MVDRGKGDARHILGVNVHRDVEKDQHKIAVNADVLKGQYSKNQLDLCPQRLPDKLDVKPDISVSLRASVTAQSYSDGQYFAKNANSVEQRIVRQICFKAKLQCSSRYHSSLTCANK
jgi:hypothetical protein